MIRNLLFACVVLTSSWAFGQVPPEQERGEQERSRDERRAARRERRADQNDERRDDRREDRRGERRGEGRRGERRGGPGGPGGPFGGREEWERYRNASPEERERMRNERMLQMTARNYDLDEAQTEQVRAEMNKMREERKALMGLDYDRMEQLREQMFEYWRRPRSGDRGDGDGRDFQQMRDNPEFQRIREEMRELEQKYPFDIEASIRRIEALLPPEQAAKGRERFESRRMQWQDRRQQREGDAQATLMDALRSSERAMAEGNNDRARELLDEAARQVDSGRLSDEMRQQLKRSVEETRTRLGVDAPKVEVAAEHPWEKHVREYVGRHGFSTTQQSAAASILKDVRSRAAQIEVANASKLAAAKEISDSKEREARLKELNAPIEKLFQELNIRLDGLLTAEQRRKAGI